jgi:hypothetical protein
VGLKKSNDDLKKVRDGSCSQAAYHRKAPIGGGFYKKLLDLFSFCKYLFKMKYKRDAFCRNISYLARR